MTLGLEQAIAEYLNAEGFGGLYDDPDPAQCVIFVAEEPRGAMASPAEATARTTSELIISVFVGGGGELLLGLYQRHGLEIRVRHPKYETAMSTAYAIHALLHENGGQSNGANASAQGLFRNDLQITRIMADEMPRPLERDTTEEGGRMAVSQRFSVFTLPFAPS